MTQPPHQPNSSPDAELSPEGRRQVKRLFLILLSIGLVLGAIVAIGVVKVMDRLGLTDEPSPVVPQEPK